MNLFINTSDVKNFIKHGFEYKKSNDNKYNRLEYMIYCDGFDYMILIAEWTKGEKTALHKNRKRDLRRYKLYDIRITKCDLRFDK